MATLNIKDEIRSSSSKMSLRDINFESWKRDIERRANEHVVRKKMQKLMEASR